MIQTEQINFEIVLFSTFWDQPPAAKIYLDGIEHFDDKILEEKKITFSQNLNFFTKHTLILERYNKTPSQCRINEFGVLEDQTLQIKQVIIDGIDIRNLIWSKSMFSPQYPKLWAAQQKQQGIELEKTIAGETILGHNGTWTYEFYSPFWQFLIKEMNND